MDHQEQVLLCGHEVNFHLIEYYARWDPQSALCIPTVIFVSVRGQVISFGPSISDR